MHCEPIKFNVHFCALECLHHDLPQDYEFVLYVNECVNMHNFLKCMTLHPFRLATSFWLVFTK